MSDEKKLRYDKAYLRIAHEWGKLSHCKRKQVGAIIVKDRMIISDGYNGTPTGFENYCEDDEGYTKRWTWPMPMQPRHFLALPTLNCS